MALRKPALNVKDARRLAGVGDLGANTDEARSAPAVSLVPAAPVPLPELAPEVSPPALPEVDDLSSPEDAMKQVGLPEADMADDIDASAPVSPPAAKAAALPARNNRAPVAMAKATPRNVPTLPHSQVKQQIFLSAHPPAQGMSKSYDMLIERYSPAKALQMILRRAMDEYEQRLADGTYVNCRETYETDPQSPGHLPVQTSRIMAEALVERARRHFDPLGFESARAFGFKLATAALANFFAEEARYRRRNGSE